MKKLFVLILLVVSILVFKDVFDRGVYNFSPIEIGNNFSRQEYLGNQLGRIYKNRYGIFYFDNIYPNAQKLKTVLFSSLGNKLIYVPFIVFLVYAGIKKHGEK